jgi:hypothetical protein
MKKWYKSKLIWLGIISIALGIIQEFNLIPWLDSHGPVMTAIVGFVTILLRIITGKEIIKKNKGD